MVEIMAVVVEAVLLLAILLFVGERSPDFPKILLLTIFLTLLNAGISHVARPMGPFVLAPLILVDAALLRYWQNMTWPRALVAMTLLFAVTRGIRAAFEP